MSLSIALTPGYVFKDGDILTPALLRLIAQPTVLLNGSIGTIAITDGSVTTVKLADGALAATTQGRGKMADGFLTLSKIASGIFTADTSGRAPFASGWLNQALMDDTTRLDAAGYAAGTTAAGAMTATLSPAPASYFAGMTVKILVDATNTGAVTLNLNGLGAVFILKNVNRALSPGDLVANDIVTLIHDGTQFQLQRRNGAAVVASGRNIVATNSGSSTNVNVTADELVLKNTDGAPVLLTTVNVTGVLSASGMNGLDTGSRATGTWYYFYVIYNGTTVAALFSASRTAPTLPAGYTAFALVGAAYNSSGNALVNFHQADRQVFLDPQAALNGAGATSYTSLTLAAMVPPNAKSCFGQAGINNNTGGALAVAGNSTGLGAMAVILSTSSNNMDTFTGVGTFDIPLPTAQTLYYKTDASSSKYRITITGFRI